MPVSLLEDGRIVHKHVQVPELFADLPGKRCTAGSAIVQVCWDETDAQTLITQLRGSVFTPSLVSRSEQHRETRTPKLSSDLETDTLVRTRD